MSERSTQKGDAEVGTCHVCGIVFATQEELSKHLIDAHGGLASDAHDGLASDEPVARDPGGTQPAAGD